MNIEKWFLWVEWHIESSLLCDVMLRIYVNCENWILWRVVQLFLYWSYLIWFWMVCVDMNDMLGNAAYKEYNSIILDIELQGKIKSGVIEYVT